MAFCYTPRMRIKNKAAREMLAEFIGTFILVSFAIAAGAQYVLSKGALSSFLSVNIAGGLGLTFGIYFSFGVSAGSLNPAVTLALCLHGVISWSKFPLYTIAELGGAFVAALVQYAIYYDAISAYDGGLRRTVGPNSTAGIFSTFPSPEVSTATCFFDQVWGTLVLVACILAVTDQRNTRPVDKGLLPLALGAIVLGIGLCWGYNCGYAINPARDFGPRLFTSLAGWGMHPFSFRNYNWFWVPIVGPMCGSIMGWAVYVLFVQLHWPPEEEKLDVNMQVTVLEKGTEKSGHKDNAENGNHKAVTAGSDLPATKDVPVSAVTVNEM